MKVRVMKAGEDSYWYAKHIGEEFEVHDYKNRHGEYVLVKEAGGGTFEIDADDCEIITE